MNAAVRRGAHAAVLALCLTQAAASAEDAREIMVQRPARTGPKELSFDSLADVFPSGSTKLVNGTAIIDVGAWAAVLVARLDSGDYCTASLIGPRVLLTAAHCVDAGAGTAGETIGGRVNIAGSQFAIKSCSMHPVYAKADRPTFDVPRASEDYALCELDGAPNVLVETITSSPSVGPGSRMLMTGYGCTGIRVVANTLAYDTIDSAGDEQLRLGDARIEAVGVSGSHGAKGSYIRTRAPDKQPILCPGDSGGPALSGATLALQDGPIRRVIGVNSKVTALPNGSKYDFLSYVAWLGAPTFIDFAGKWTAKAPATRQICGRDLAAGVSPCRA